MIYSILFWRLCRFFQHFSDMANDENQLIAKLQDAGNKLMQPPSSIHALLNLLDDVEVLLKKVGQSPSHQMQEAIFPSMKALIADELLRNSHEDVRISVAACLSQIMRISAPIAPYNDQLMKDIFVLIIASFDKLSSLYGRWYSKAVAILATVARLRACLMMLDLDCDPLITKLFELFLKTISPKHPHAVFLAMKTTMSVLIKESDVVSEELVKVLLASIRKDNNNASPASWTLGAKVIEECSEKLKPHIIETLDSMGCSLEDFVPILSSICKVEVEAEADTLRRPDGDSAQHVERSNASAGRSPAAECVQSLRAVECSTDNADTNANGNSFDEGANTRVTALKRARKPNSRYFGEECEIWTGKRKESSVVSPRCRAKKTSAPKKGRLSNRDIAEGSPNKSGKGPSIDGEAQQDGASEPPKSQASLGNDADVIEAPYGRKEYKEDLIGRRIKVWWPLDRRYYEGTISSYDLSTKIHKVDYDDGDHEFLNLQKESWEFIHSLHSCT